MTVCPCCGFKFEGDLQRDGCKSCGARAVGPPLSRPAHELPFYGRALFVGALGGVMLITFLTSTIIALFEHAPVSLRFRSLVSAAEIAAWRLKWIALPATLLTLWASSLICASIRRNPKRFAGSRIAHTGLTAAALVGIEASAYNPGADLASLPKKKPRSLRGSALRNASLRSTDDSSGGGIAFTKYELHLPGPDKKLGTEDDWIMRDGVIIKPVASEEQPTQSADTSGNP